MGSNTMKSYSKLSLGWERLKGRAAGHPGSCVQTSPRAIGSPPEQCLRPGGDEGDESPESPERSAHLLKPP